LKNQPEPVAAPLAFAASSIQPPTSSLSVLRVREGGSSADQRTFTVTLSRVPTDEELDLVAQAVDPVTGVAIPSEGQAHLRQPELVALPPELHAVGLADKRSGVLMASRSAFYNIRVRYQKPPATAGAQE
jgi:hypothetical protein